MSEIMSTSTNQPCTMPTTETSITPSSQPIGTPNITPVQSDAKKFEFPLENNRDFKQVNRACATL